MSWNSPQPSLYQAFAIVWHLERGDVLSARIVARYHPAVFWRLAEAMRRDKGLPFEGDLLELNGLDGASTPDQP